MPTSIGRINNRVLKDLLHKEFSPRIGSGQALPKETLHKLLRNNEVIKQDKHLQDVANAVIYGKNEHSIEEWKVKKFLKSIGNIAAGSEKVAAKLSYQGRKDEKQGARATLGSLKKKQAAAEKPTGPTPQELEHEKIVHERRMNVAKLYRQWAIDKEQGGVLGGRFQPGSNARTSVLNSDDPRGSVTPDSDKAMGSVSDSRTVATSASDVKTDGTRQPASTDKPQSKPTEKSGQNPETTIPAIAGGVPDATKNTPDVEPVTEGTMQVGLPSETPVPASESAPSENTSETSDTAPADRQTEIDDDLPLGP